MSTDIEKQTPLLAGKRIIVSGAGLAGLSFVRALQRTWPHDVPPPRISVYERDPRHLTAQRGNYSLAVRSDKASRGLQALQKLDLVDEVFAARAPGSEGANSIRNAKWETIASLNAAETPPDGLPCDRMRITRHAIRECLIQGTERDTEMHWETTCTSLVTLENGTVEVTLSDGSKTICDVLIIADGASSKLRGQLRPNDTLQFAGACMVGGQAAFEDGSVPAPLAASGGPLLGGEGHGLVVFPTAPNEYVWFVTRRSPSPQEVIKGENDVQNQKYIANEARKEGRVFGEPFDQLVAATDPDSLKTMNAMDKTPMEHSGIAKNPYIFIGDSNHAVSPFAGNGANMALVDGVSLAEALCHAATLEEAVQTFDNESLPRCRATVNKSHWVISLSHNTGWRHWLFVWALQIVNYFFLR